MSRFSTSQTFRIDGLKELDKALTGLDEDLRNKSLRQALRPALEPTMDLAKTLVPKDTGDLRSTFRINAKKGNSRQQAAGRMAFATLTVGHRTRAKPGAYALQVEFGTPERGIPPHPFLVPAFEASAGTALYIFRDGLRKRIEQYAKTQARRTKRRLK